MSPDPRLEADIRNLAQATEADPGQLQISLIMSRRLGISDPARQTILNAQLAYAYAQGYIRGLATGRARRIGLPPPPAPREEV